LEDLYIAVRDASRAGKSLEELKQTLRDEFLPLNIEGMYRRINMNRLGN
jgi:hypothetical protein